MNHPEIEFGPGVFAGVGIGRTLCRDCRIEAWHQWDERQGCFAHEDFYVHHDLWDRICPDDLVEEIRDCRDGRVLGRNGTYVLCIGCFERRLGRELRPSDFIPGQDPFGEYWSVLVGRPPTFRFCDRLRGRSAS